MFRKSFVFVFFNKEVDVGYRQKIIVFVNVYL